MTDLPTDMEALADDPFASFESRNEGLREGAEEIRRLQLAILSLIRGDNSCFNHLKARETCSGWNAERCGCAIEARNLLPPKGEGR